MIKKVRRTEGKDTDEEGNREGTIKADGPKYKASYTVELALLSGIWLFLIFASLLLILGTYAEVRDTAKAAEGAAVGSINGVPRQGDGLSAASVRIKKEKGFSVSGSNREIRVSYSDTMEIPYWGLKWKREGVIKSKVIRPVRFIEKVEKSKRFLENLTG